MSLGDRLSEDLKQAMKARDQLRMDVIRMIKAAILNKEVELKKDLDDAEMSRIMTTLIKQRRESVEQFEKAQRNELADKERAEIVVLNGLSSHADHGDLLRMLGPLAGGTRRVRLVHGEPERAEKLVEGLKGIGFADVAIPDRGDTALESDDMVLALTDLPDEPALRRLLLG